MRAGWGATILGLPRELSLRLSRKEQPWASFSKPMPDGKGGTIPPTGKAFAIDMVTVGIWNRQGTKDEEFFFWGNQIFYSKMGLA
jgi:hypothetical protein